jgi:hypothetical protein
MMMLGMPTIPGKAYDGDFASLAGGVLELE